MKLKSIKIAVFAAFTFSVLWFTAEGVKAETKNIKITPAEVTTNGDEAESGGAVDTASQGGITATSQPGDEDQEENITGVEIFDEFSVGGILYTVTNIKGNKVYLGVSGVVNDRVTTVFIPKKIKYKGNEMVVTSIEDDGFSYMDRLRKVVVGANITYIGEDAFRESVKFDRLVIKTNKLKKVGKNIFKGAGKKLIIGKI